jgi:hypothetical protein
MVFEKRGPLKECENLGKDFIEASKNVAFDFSTTRHQQC